MKNLTKSDVLNGETLRVVNNNMFKQLSCNNNYFIVLVYDNRFLETVINDKFDNFTKAKNFYYSIKL